MRPLDAGMLHLPRGQGVLERDVRDALAVHGDRRSEIVVGDPQSLRRRVGVALAQDVVALFTQQPDHLAPGVGIARVQEHLVVPIGRAVDLPREV